MNGFDRATAQTGGPTAGAGTIQERVTLSAFGAPATEAVATVRHRSLAARAGRAGLALGIAWLLAFPAIFLPVAHFVLVPGLIIGGVVVAVMRLAEARTLACVRGVCPRCKTTLDLKPGGRYRLPRSVQCARCRNELTIAAPVRVTVNGPRATDQDAGRTGGKGMGRQLFRALLVTLALVLVSGCAGTGTQAARPLPPARALQPADLASLAGEWQGTLEGTAGQGPFTGRRTSLVRVTVAPDGSFTSNISGVPGAGKGRIEDGKVVFEGSATRGVATYHEGDGRRILKGEGTWVGYDGRSAFELTKR